MPQLLPKEQLAPLPSSNDNATESLEFLGLSLFCLDPLQIVLLIVSNVDILCRWEIGTFVGGRRPYNWEIFGENGEGHI